MIRLSPDEAWEALQRAHTGILTTLRRDGMPVTLPIWFVVDDRTIAFSAPSHTKKVQRVRHDHRASFLIESGKAWAELFAVHLTGTVEILEDEADIARVAAALSDKYAAFRPAASSMPEKTQEHYAVPAYMRLIPDERILSWDNSRIRLATS